MTKGRRGMEGGWGEKRGRRSTEGEQEERGQGDVNDGEIESEWKERRDERKKAMRGWLTRKKKE